MGGCDSWTNRWINIYWSDLLLLLDAEAWWMVNRNYMYLDRCHSKFVWHRPSQSISLGARKCASIRNISLQWIATSNLPIWTSHWRLLRALIKMVFDAIWMKRIRKKKQTKNKNGITIALVYAMIFVCRCYDIMLLMSKRANTEFCMQPPTI